jgi:preprotein translocase subunit SecA
MDTRTGDIYDYKQAMIFLKENPILVQFFRPTPIEPTVAQKFRKPTNAAAIGKVGRNDSCPCGSGKKFKKCCLERR